METVLIKALQLVLAFSILIILHEGGHFFFAKIFKVRVEKFYLFFDWKFNLFSTYAPWFRKLIGKKPVPKRKDKDGKELSEYEYEGTEYGIGWIPLGGYVKISGMIDESMDKEQMKQPPQPWEFRTKPAWQRLFIMLGGVIVNFILAFIIYSGVLFVWGESYTRPQDMTYGLKFNEQAKADGFKDGDIIIRLDEEEVDRWSPAVLQDMANAKTAIVLRNGKEVSIALPEGLNLMDMIEAPRYADTRLPLCVDSVMEDMPAGKIGLKKGDVINAINGIKIADYNDLINQIATLQEGLSEESTSADSLRKRTVALVINNTDTVNAVLTSEFKLGFTNKIPDYKITTKEYGLLESIPAGIKYGCETLVSYVDQMKYVFTKKGARNVGGFIGIAKIFPDEWDWQRFWLLTAFLSVALGFMNVLPIPALDGGHALFTIYEIITGKKPGEKFLERAQYVGMFLILALLIFANLNDILRLFGL